MINVSICIPVVRIKKSLECIEAIHENSGVDKSSYEIITAVDHERIGCPRMLTKLVERAKYEWICYLGDDTLPQKDWLKNAINAIRIPRYHSDPPQTLVVGLNSGENDHAHFLVHRDILRHIEGGHVFSHEYHHCYGDDELKDIAMSLDAWAYAEDSIIEHKHPVFGTAPPDETYNLAYGDGKDAQDEMTYRRRKIDRMLKVGEPLVAIGIPLTDLKVYTHFMFSFLKLDKPSNYCIFMPNYPGQHDAVRNDLVTQAFKSNCTHILMMDTDQIYTDKDLITRMLSHNLPVVGARVHRRYPPFDPLVLRGKVGKLEPVPDAEIEAAMKNGNPLVKVDATGCGCILYDMRVFTQIPRPWFEFTTNKETGFPIGEDIGFCMKLKEHGYDVHVDCSIDIQHLTLHATDWNTYKVWQKIQGAKDGANLKPQ